jgi:hypothetical protein
MNSVGLNIFITIVGIRLARAINGFKTRASACSCGRTGDDGAAGRHVHCQVPVPLP